MKMNLKQRTFNLLRFSEKWAHTDMIYLAKGGFWISASKLIGVGTSLCLAIAYAKFLSKEDYGLFKYILSISTFFSITVLAGLNDSLSRGVALGFEGMVGRIIKLKTKFSLIGIGAGVAVAAYYFINHNNTLGFGFLITAILSPLNDSLFIYGCYLNGKRLFRLNAIYNSLYQIFIAIGIILTLAYAPSITHLVLAYFLSGFLLNFIFNYLTYKKYPPNDKVDEETISFGKHLSAMGILGLVSSQIDKILLWHFLGPVQLAIYSYATIPIDSFDSFVMKSISPLALPKLSTQKKEELKKTLPAKIFKFSMILFLPAILYYFISPFLFKLLFPEYLDSVKYTQIYAFALLLFPGRFFSTSLIAHAQKKSLYITSTILPILKIFSLALFIYLWGINGAIASLLFNLLSGYIINYYYFYKI